MLHSPVLNWLTEKVRRLSIGTKISGGYTLALGIAVIGTATGILIGEQYYDQSRMYAEDAREEIRLLSRLETTLLRAKTHQQQLSNLLRKSERRQEEYFHIIENYAELNQLWSEFKSTEGQTKNSKVKEFSEEIRLVKHILQNHEKTIDAYLRQVEVVLKQLAQPKLTTEEYKGAQKLILKLNTGSLPLEIDHMSNDVAALTHLAYKDYEKEEAKSSKAQRLRLQIIGVSMFLSVTSAIFLSMYTSRAISQPIKKVTTVVQQIAQDSNFDRQVPVTTEDEIGTLARAFNTLIQQIAAYIQELSQKNQQLLQTHEELSQTLENLQQTQVQLIQTEKMSSLGQMVASIAHEIKNPVNFISNNLEYANNYTQDLLELVHLYQQDYPNPTPLIQHHIQAIDCEFLAEDLPKILSSMKMGTESLRQLVLSLGNFSRLDEAEMVSADLHTGIESTLLILNHQLKYGIEVIKQYGDLPLVECHPAQLNQVFMNIVQNAIDALQSAVDQQYKQIMIKTQAMTSNQIKVGIRDNGLGISQESIKKIFEPFFTTKGVGKGTGLGLSISYQIIKKHQGQIAVNSQLGEGTEFVIVLPIKQSICPSTPI
ncbi:MAG TPA: hypothetical protein DCE56_36825 [Cyanobacteria bacterium UBA8553]|nr:hypothetical protein [Cyanobacteria bacterium UBA8553]HAJ57929.1 hypothetical protein [Cyanobacteria bacterium UBA8543]